MSSTVRFSETRLEQEPRRLRLLGPRNEVLLTVAGHEIDDAIRAGFLDQQNFHFSMYEYLKLRALAPMAPAAPVAAQPQTQGTAPQSTDDADFDRSFLSDLRISWD